MDIQPTESSPLRDHLLADHRRIEQQIEQLLAAFEANDQSEIEALWTRFDARLMAHLETEEKHLIPALVPWNGRNARAIIHEHRHIRERMVELGAAIDLHLCRLEAMRNFLDELRAHSRTEDKLLYEQVDGRLSEPEKTSILADLARALQAKLEKHPQ